MDIAEVAIKVQAFAEGAIETLEAVKDVAQDTAKAASQKVKINIDGTPVKSAVADAKALESGLKGVSKAAVEALRNAAAAYSQTKGAFKGDAMAGAQTLMNELGVNMETAAQLITDFAKSATGDAEALLTSFVQNAEEIAKSAATSTQAVADASMRAAEQTVNAWGPAASAANQTADGLGSIAPAAATAGTAAQVAGAQAAAGAITATVGTTAWAKATEKLKLVLGGVAGMAAALITREVISFITGWIGKLVSAREEAEKLRLETAKLNKETADEGQGRVEKLDTMIRRYEELSRKQILTAAEDRELASLQEQLADSYDLRARGLDGVVKSNERYLEIAKELRQEELEQLAIAQQKVSQDAYVAAFNKDVTDALGKREAALKRVADKQAILDRLQAANVGTDISGYGQGAIEKAQRELAYAEANAKLVVSATKKVLDENSGLFTDWYNAAIDEAKTRVQASGGEWSDQIEAVLRPLVEFDLSRFSSEEEAKAFVDSIISSIGVAMNDADLSGAMVGLGGLVNQIFAGDMSAEDAVAKITEQLNLIQQVAYEAFVKMGMSCEEANAKAIALRSSLTGGLGAQEFATDIAKAGREATIAASGFGDLAKKQKEVDDSIGKARNLVNHVKDAENAVSAYKKLSKEMQTNPAEIAKVSNAVGKLGLSFDGTEQSLENVEKGFTNLKDSLADQAQVLMADILNLEAEFAALGDAAYVDGVITADASKLMDAIAMSKKELDALIAKMIEAGVDVKIGKGKGGGSKKSTPSASTSSSSGPSAYEKAMEQLRHLKALEQVTYEQELAYLENIRKKYKLSGDERKRLEEDIYAVKKQIWERDAAEVDKMGQGIKDALAARYEAMQEAELTRLDESRKAWEQWRDDSVKAINDQIAALDKLSQTEDREKKDAEELRKIAKLRQDVEFEQDDYNRMKLQQQLDQAIAAREDRLRKQALDDQKAALREEITAIQEKANQQISAINDEQDAIQQAYAERLKSAALQAEAERMIMANNQDEIIALLGEYAPEYDALGKTLGEKLLDGFKDKVGSVIDWFKSLNDTLYNIQQNAASQAIAAADAFSNAYAQRQAAETSVPPTTIVEQTVIFNEPVESATQVARRLDQANQDLGELLARG